MTTNGELCGHGVPSAEYCRWCAPEREAADRAADWGRRLADRDATIAEQAAEIATLRAALEDKRVDRWHATYNAGISACRDVETIGAVSDACDYAVECANRLHGPLPEVPHE